MFTSTQDEDELPNSIDIWCEASGSPIYTYWCKYAISISTCVLFRYLLDARQRGDEEAE